MKKIIPNIFRLFFRPQVLIEMATKELEEGGQRSLEDAQRQASAQVNDLRHGLRESLTLVLSSLGLAYLANRALRFSMIPISHAAANACQFVGAGLLLWAAVWQISQGYKTMGGNTLTERLHGQLIRAFCFVGTFLFGLAYSSGM